MAAHAASDSELVGQVLAGRREAFAGLVERYLKAATAVARVRLANPADTEDAVQEAFLRAFERLGTLHDRAKFGPWLLTIARHEAVRIDARKKSTRGAADPPRESATEPDPARAELGDMLRERIASLPELSRDVLMLHYFAGHTTREIADLLGATQSAVLKRLERARGQLAESMLADLEATRPTDDSLAKQLGRVLAVTSAATLPSAIATSTAVAGGGMLSASALTKIFAVAAGVALAGTVFFVANPQRMQAEYSADTVATGADSIAVSNNAPTAADAATDLSGSAPSIVVAQQPVGPSQAIQTNELEVRGSVETADVDKALQTTVTWEASGKHITQVLRELEESFGLRFLIDTHAVGLPVYSSGRDVPAPRMVPYASSGNLAEVDIHDVPLATALQLIASELGLEAVLEPGYVWISTPVSIRRESRRQVGSSAQNFDTSVLDKIISAEFSDVHIKDVLDFLSAAHDLNVALDQRVVAPAKGLESHTELTGRKVTTGIIQYINLRNVRLVDTLDALCRLLNLNRVLRNEFIWLSSAEQIRRDGLLDAPAEARQPLDATLNNPVSVVFEEIDMRQIADFIHGAYKLKVIMDQRVVVWKNEPTGASPLHEGIRAESLSHGMLDRLIVKEMPIGTYLEVLARQVDLASEVRSGFILVSSRERLRGAIAPGDLVPPGAFPAVVPPAPPAPDVSAPGPEAKEPCDEMLLINVQMASDEHARAVFDFCGKAKVYAEGESFNQYKVLSIQLDPKCVTLFDEELSKELKLCM